MSRHSQPPSETPVTFQPAAPERLQKILASAGIGSRRQCEELILTGRVEVDGKVVSQLGAKADPLKQQIRIDGTPLPRPKLVYYMVNKPTGVVSTNSDPSGRPRVIDLLPAGGERLFTVGRLDMSSEGLILATNDGELANRLTHPRYGVEKTYHVEVAGDIDREHIATLRKGVYLAEGFARAVSVRVKGRYHKSTLLEIVLDEGRNREIRRLLARVGHKVMRLKRVALGPVRLGELPSGACRSLEHDEVKKLWQEASPAARRQRARQKSAARKLGDSAPPRTAAPEKNAAPQKTAAPQRAAVAQKTRAPQKAKVAVGAKKSVASLTVSKPFRPTIIGGDAERPGKPKDNRSRKKPRPIAVGARKGRRG